MAPGTADDAASVVSEDRQRLVDRAVVTPVHHRDLRSPGEVAGQSQDEPVGIGGGRRQLPLRHPEPSGELGADPGGVGRRQHGRQPDRCLVGDRVGDSPDTVPRHRTGVAEAEVDVLDAVDVDESRPGRLRDVDREGTGPPRHPGHRHAGDQMGRPLGSHRGRTRMELDEMGPLGAQQLGEAVTVDRRRRMAGHLGRLACHVPAGDFRSGAPAHVRDHQPPRRGQDHAHREVPAVRRCDHVGRGGQGARGPAGGDVRLDGHGAEARDLDHLDGAQLPLPRSRVEPARHAGSPRLLRGHLPRAVGRRRRGDGARLGQGHRTADPEAVRGLPLAQPAGDHVPQQARPSRHGAAGTARPDRGADRPAPHAGDLAGRVAR